jgi:mono/diheme cytochrome c family protein
MVSRRTIWIWLAVAALVAVGVGCGAKEQPDLANGKRLFLGTVPKDYQKQHPKYTACGGCHELSRAGAKGTQGPSLDGAFAQARQDGMTSKTFEGVVEGQINSPRRGSVMPADIVTGDDARDVAAYVASVAAQPGKDQGQLAAIGGAANSKPIAAKGGVLTMPADPQRTLFASTAATAPAGKLTLKMPNPSSLQHDIGIKGGAQGPVVGNGGVSTVTVDLKPGKYEYFCSVPGHEQNGMKGTLTVK